MSAGLQLQHQHRPFKPSQTSGGSLSRRLQIWGRDKLLLTIFICQLLFSGGLIAITWSIGRRYGSGNGSAQLRPVGFIDDPLSLARHDLRRTQSVPTAAFAADVSDPQRLAQQGPDLSTLVLYVFSPTDPEYINNLMYFMREGIQPNDGVDYVIIVNQAMGEELMSFSAMAAMASSLPPNARYITHKNECYDWGTLGWLLSEGKIEAGRYNYVLFINSSVRGPFLPAYWPRSVHWSRIFTDRIDNSTKLVGPTISCEGIQPVGWPLRKNPHVQSFVVAMDQTGLQVLLREGHVFQCYNHIHLTMFHSELGASKAILDAGYNIDSLMLRYQGIDWRDKAHWECNANESPYKESHYDGVNVDPLEALFVKVKEPLLELRYSASVKAQKYDQWSANAAAAADPAQPKPRDVSSNTYQSLAPDFRPVVLTADGKSVTGKCFDIGYYKLMSPELQWLENKVALQHFAAKGQFEGRHFRFVHC